MAVPRFGRFAIRSLVDETLREGVERCAFPVPARDLYRLVVAQADAGIRDFIVGIGPADTALLELVCEGRARGDLPGDVRCTFLVLLNCWEATFQSFRGKPREWIESTTFGFAMLPHQRQDRLFERVVGKFRDELGIQRAKVSVLNNFVDPLATATLDQMRWQIDWALDCDITSIRINDSMGKLEPHTTGLVCGYLARSYPDVTFCLHCHNDNGLALANQLTSLYHGFSSVEGSLCGYGNRAGITPLEPLARLLAEREIAIDGVDLDPARLAANARLADDVFLAIPDPYRPVSGRLVNRTHYGVLNIPDFLEAEGERDYFLNLPNLHASTVIAALERAGVDPHELGAGVIDATVAQLRALIHHRSRNARTTHAAILTAIDVLDRDSQVSLAEVVEVARSLARCAA
jgi:2-isopropylmalate synthase